MPRIRQTTNSSLRGAQMVRATTLFAVGAALFAPGCKAGLDGPTPALTTVSPRVVCGGSNIRVIIEGSGLSGVPVGVLSGAPGVAVPRIFLQRVEDLKGLATSDEPFRIPDDPSKPDQAKVHAISDTQLAFDVTPDLNLPTGIYSIEVLSPSAPELKKARLDKIIAITAAPTIKGMLDPAKACLPGGQTPFSAKVEGFLTTEDNNKVDVTITPSGEGATKMYEGSLNGCTPLPMDLVPAINVSVCNEIHFSVAGDDFPNNGSEQDVEVKFTNRAPANACTPAVTTVTLLPPPRIDQVKRNMVGTATMCAKGTTQTLDVQGKNFVKMANVFIAGQKAMKTTVNSDVDLTVDVSNLELQVGQKYDVDVYNPDSCRGTAKMAIDIVGGPEVLFVDPPQVWTGIATPMAIYMRAVMGDVTKVEFAKNGAAMQMWTAMTAAADADHANRVLTSVPKGTAPATYDLRITDGSGCPAIVKAAFKVVDNGGPRITSITRPTGPANTRVVQTITGTSFVSVPILFLSNPAGMGAAIPVPSVAFVSATELAATFPGVPAAVYDLVAINPDGGVGVLQKAFTVGGVAPPRIDSVTPTVFNADVKLNFTINGANFHDMAKNGVEVTVKCSDNINRLMSVNVPSPTSLKVSGTDFSTAKPGTTCVVRVTNTDDMGFAEYAAIAISNPNGGAVTGKAGPRTRSAREAPATTLVAPIGSPHYIVAAGGDTGDQMKASLLDSVETLQIDGTGAHGGWIQQRNKLPVATSLAGAAALGRYVYFLGGNDGSTAVKSVYRAMLLDPSGAPAITDSYLEPAVGMGLAAGRYSYRVGALLDAMNADNPGGESVGSDPWVVNVPMLMSGAQVTLTWKKVAGAVGYAIYRSPMGDGGTEQLIGMVGDVASYVDMGGMAMGAGPLPTGSMSKWVAVASLGTARQNPAVTLVGDPNKPDIFYLYAVAGSDGNADLSSYEVLTITVNNDGTQAAGAMWTSGAEKLLKARTMAGAWTYSANGTTYLYVGGGKSGNIAASTVEVATITPNTGALGKFTDTTATLPVWGFAPVAAGAQLLTAGNNTPDTKLYSTTVGNTPLTLTSFAAAGDSITARFLPGAVIDGPLLWVVGGLSQGLAINDTEWMVY